MKTVYFIRHAKSSWAEPGLRDIDRPLNDRGLRDAPFMAQLLKNKGVRPDRIVSSPAKRALSTARFFADAMGISEIQVEARIYEAYPEDILEVVQELPDADNTVLVFGHNPGFHYLSAMFATTPVEDLPTCGIFRVDAEVENWHDFDNKTGKLSELYYPKQFHK